MNEHRINERHLGSDADAPAAPLPLRRDRTELPREGMPDLPLIPSRNWPGSEQLSLFVEYSAELKAEEARLVTPPVPRRTDPRLAQIFTTSEQVSIEPGITLTALVTDYVEDRLPAFQVRGAHVRTYEDAAAVFAALRSPYVERLSWMIVDEGDAPGTGRVAGSGILTVGSIDACETPMAPADWRDLVQVSERCRAPMLWIAHNHPSGDPTPSGADFRAYANLHKVAAQFGMGFRGLVLNGSEFVHLDPLGHTSWRMPYKNPIARPYEAVLKEDVAWDFNLPEKVGTFFKRLQWDQTMWVGLFLDSSLRLRALRTYAHQPAQSDLRIDLASLASPSLILGVNAELGQRMTNHPILPQITDILELRGDSWTSHRRLNPGAFVSSRIL